MNKDNLSVFSYQFSYKMPYWILSYFLFIRGEKLKHSLSNGDIFQRSKNEKEPIYIRYFMAILVLMLFLLFCVSCTPPKETVVKQDQNYWVVLNSNEAKSIEGSIEWNFNLNQPEKYDFQIICEGVLDSPLADVKVETAGLTLNESPEKIMVIGEGNAKQTVFQFSKNIVFKDTGSQILKVETAAPFTQVRITPTYRHKLGFGSGKYEAEWRKMHNSPEKKAGLEWLKEAKYGKFIHWGLYAQEGGIWKGVRMEDSGYPGPGVSEWLMFKFRIPRRNMQSLQKPLILKNHLHKILSSWHKDRNQ